MTDDERAQRLAALRSMRGQDPLLTATVEATPATMPAGSTRARRPHAAMGARILVTGLSASAVLGLTTTIAAANRPHTQTADPATPSTTATPATTLPVTVVTAPAVQTVVLSVPPPATTQAAAAPAPRPATPPPTPAPAAAAPVATPAPTPPPAPPATSKPSA